MLQQDVTQQMLSSLALFKGIAQSHKGDVWAIVRDFIIATVKRRKLASFDVQTLRDEMVQEFNIDIENAVLSKVIGNLELITYKKELKQFVPTDRLLDFDIKAFNSEFSDNLSQCEQLLNELLAFYSEENNIDCVDETTKIYIQDYLFRYVIDREKVSKGDPLSILINRFVLKFENDEKRKALFSNIRQGLIMLEGLNFSKSTDSRTWPTETTFFLDAHYLFSYYGFNSKYHKESVTDFIKLVNKINDGSPVKQGGRRRLVLTYFPETKIIMKKFFNTAMRIKMGDEMLKPQNEAMTKIVDMCKEPEDVPVLENKFYKFLEDNKIEEYSSSLNLIKCKDYLYETNELNDLIEQSFQEEDYEEVRDLFLFADYINILRKGQTVRNLENCRYIFLTDKTLCIQVSKFLKRKDEQARTHVFEKMDWFTQRMWYLTCQSFTFDESLTSFDLAIKAKIVLSGICRSNVADIFEEMKEKNAPPEEAAVMYKGLRNYDYSADNINNSNSKEIVEKFSSGAFDQFHESYQRMIEKAERTEAAENELRDIKVKLEDTEKSKNELSEDNTDLHNQLDELKKTIRLILWIAIPIFLILIIVILFILLN